MSTFNQELQMSGIINGYQPVEIRKTQPSRLFSNNFDYCMVFPLEGDSFDKQTDTTKYVIQTLIDAGFELFCYKSVQQDELICLIKANEIMLAEFADKIDYKMLLDPVKAKEMMEKGNPQKEIKPHKINGDPKYASMSPYDFIWTKFENSKIDLFYYNREDSQEFAFSELNRLRLIYYLLKAAKRINGCGLELLELLRKNKILALYPLHNNEAKKQILEKCMNPMTYPWMFPFGAIRNYFGEKICLYFHFMGHYSAFLILPGIIGFAFQIVVWWSGNFSHPVLPFFSVLISLWAIVMLELWKRKQAYVSLFYGMLDFEEEEPDRPEFVGELIPSYITGEPMVFFDPNSAGERVAQSYSIIVTFILMICGVLAGIYILRYTMQQREDEAAYASVVASALNSAQITIFNFIYLKMANKLTDLENHRTDTQYEDNMIVKIFAFTFVNSFASFFYIAFVAANLPKTELEIEKFPDYKGQCGWTDCMRPLMINLAIIFGVRLVITNTLDIIIPYYNKVSKQNAETKLKDGKGQIELELLTDSERDYVLQEYDVLNDNIANFSDTVVQYGYMTLFITALPISCIITFFCNYIRMKLHAWRLISMYQRPIPVGAQDIGSWQSIFLIVSVIAVLTNAGLIVFTMDLGLDPTWAKYVTVSGKYWIFIGFQWILIGLQFLISVAIPDEPLDVTIQRKRTTFLSDKLIDNDVDDDYNEPDDDPYDRASAKDNAPKPGDCCSKSFKKKKPKKISGENIPDFPVKEFPISEEMLDWPASMSKANLQAHLRPLAPGAKVVKSATSYKKHRKSNAEPEAASTFFDLPKRIGDR